MVVLCIEGWTRSSAHYACTFDTLSFSQSRMIAKVNRYVYLKFGCNWTTNMRDMKKRLFLQFLFLFFSLLNNYKRYRSETLHIPWVQWSNIHLHVQMLVNNVFMCKQPAIHYKG